MRTKKYRCAGCGCDIFPHEKAHVRLDRYWCGDCFIERFGSGRK